jgi:hypothetical protein
MLAVVKMHDYWSDGIKFQLYQLIQFSLQRILSEETCCEHSLLWHIEKLAQSKDRSGNDIRKLSLPKLAKNYAKPELTLILSEEILVTVNRYCFSYFSKRTKNIECFRDYGFSQREAYQSTLHIFKSCSVIWICVYYLIGPRYTSRSFCLVAFHCSIVVFLKIINNICLMINSGEKQLVKV